MRLLICAGGTGGGVNPALAVLRALETLVEQNAQSDPLVTLWVGGIGGMEADLVKRAGVAYEAIPAAGVHGVGLRALPRNLLQLLRGFARSSQILGHFRPDVLLFTGGYVAVPMGMASRTPGRGSSRPRSLLYVPDIEPGLALKALARFADHIAATTADTRAFLPGRVPVSVTGYPVRQDLQVTDKLDAYRTLNLDPSLPTLLVMGGSRGARSINQALTAVLPELLADMQVVHITGQLDWPEAQGFVTSLAAGLAARYHA